MPSDTRNPEREPGEDLRAPVSEAAWLELRSIDGGFPEHTPSDVDESTDAADSTATNALDDSVVVVPTDEPTPSTDDLPR